MTKELKDMIGMVLFAETSSFDILNPNDRLNI